MASKEKPEKTVVIPKSAADLQKIKLDKLFRNPVKPVYIPERPQEREPGVFRPPEFIRNIWGSSAGAGSGDFHVYRGVRRREYARQKFMDEMTEKRAKDEEYISKVKENQKFAEERTAKKRAKRQKKKQKLKAKKKKLQKSSGESESKKEESDEDEEDDDSDEDNCNDDKQNTGDEDKEDKDGDDSSEQESIDNRTESPTNTAYGEGR